MFILMRKWKIFLVIAFIIAISSLIWYWVYFGLDKLFIEEQYLELIILPGTLLQILILNILIGKRLEPPRPNPVQ